MRRPERIAILSPLFPRLRRPAYAERVFAALSFPASRKGPHAVPTPTNATVWERLFVLPILAVASGCLLWAAGCGSLTSQSMNAEGVRLFEQARYQEAADRFHEAINDDPKDADGYYNLASAYHRLGTINKSESDLKQAEHYYQMCQDRHPNHADCHRGMAVLLIEQGRKEEAFQGLVDWAEREPTLAAPRIELARLHEEFGDKKQAKDYLLEAIALDHDNVRALAALGKLREQSGNTAQALADYQRSLWYDRFQPEVAARVSALKAALDPNKMISAPAGGSTQVVDGGTALVR